MIALLGSLQSTGWAGATDAAVELVGPAPPPGVSGAGPVSACEVAARTPMQARADPPAIIARRCKTRGEVMEISRLSMGSMLVPDHPDDSPFGGVKLLHADRLVLVPSVRFELTLHGF